MKRFIKYFWDINKMVTRLMNRIRRIRERPRYAEYWYTNENLFGIMKGMDFREDDEVLAICGSGDQPLAMIETARQVWAIDHDENQIGLAHFLVDLLKRRKYSEFLEGREWDYFSIERLKRIRRNLKRLNLTQADLFSLPKELTSRTYSKIYLSNALTYGSASESQAISTLEALVRILNPKGLVYTSQCDGDRKYFESNSSFEKDGVLTERARLYHRPPHETIKQWNPSVYRKVK